MNEIFWFCLGVTIALGFTWKSNYDTQIKLNKELVLKGCQIGTTITRQGCIERNDLNYSSIMNGNEPHKLWHPDEK